jgi:hypothetical protein
VIDLREDLAGLQVHGIRRTGAVTQVPHEMQVERL